MRSSAARQERPAPGYVGAKVTSFDENTPRVLVAKFMQKYPTASREEICRHVARGLDKEYSKFLPAFIRYATINAYNAIIDGERSALRVNEARAELQAVESEATVVPIPQPSTGSAVSQTSAAQIEAERHSAAMRRIGEREQAKQDVKTVLMNLMAPNGKLWRDLSIAEYMSIGKKQFHHGQKLIKAGHKRAELLLTATSETELHKVYG